MSSNAATKNSNLFRKGSFQDPPPYKAPPAKPAPKPVIREKYTSRVDFKTILRRFDPKEEERSSGGRFDGEPRDYHRDSQFQHHMLTQNPYASPRRGATAVHTSELDFDFRGTTSPSPRNGTASPNTGSVRSLSPRRPQNLDLDLNTARRRPAGQDQLRSPEGIRRAESNPHSPRRVEFADQVLFTFSQDDLHRQFQRNSIAPAKPILRQTKNEQEYNRPQLTLMQQFEVQQHQLQQQPHFNITTNHNNPKTTIIPLVIEHANLDKVATSTRSEKDPVNQRKVSTGDSLVQIYVPPTSTNDDDGDNDGSLYNSSDEEEETETLSAGSRDEHRADDFLPDEEPQETNNNNNNNNNNRSKVGLNFLRTLSVDPSAEKEDSKNRKVPPPLSDWNRSQSFPPPGKSFVSGEVDRKVEAEPQVFGGRPLCKGISSIGSSVSCNSDIEGKRKILIPWSNPETILILFGLYCNI